MFATKNSKGHCDVALFFNGSDMWSGITWKCLSFIFAAVFLQRISVPAM
jgi:hypothetical protein